MNQLSTKIESMPSHYTQEQIQLLKNTICKGISDNDFMIFSHICKRTGLDPFARQIYAVPRKGTMTIQTGIDGYRLIAERTGKYAPGKEPSHTYDTNGKLLSATAYVKKQTADGTWHEVSATAFYSEYVQVYNGVPSQFWSKMPHGQLAKCAEALALRRAFPQEMSGIYTSEEMQQADNTILNVENEGEAPQPPTKTLLELISPDQANELRAILPKCSDELRKNLDALFKERGLQNFTNIGVKLYSQIMQRATNDIIAQQRSEKTIEATA